ncbi:hypothetical protein Bra3105_00300 [Brachybacterium halotolerans subsp. kimchii]|uniref:hypothetical protein n=1 Tax=Brachybacterium halotolerans TaxID=2795215 RepID=UPI001E3EF06F|nr:hypothetical protein [Brachybacterium halotolerans]UEJ82812.1 hypothetical protein Bra3105_00300 [Brachybacterium halotolerans subsp. kimchii]
MTTCLITTITYATGSTETEVREWPGWSAEDAASCMRARRHVASDAPDPRVTYDVPLRDIDLKAGVTRIHHEWTRAADHPDRAAAG